MSYVFGTPDLAAGVLLFGGNMDKPEFVKGEEVVFCPKEGERAVLSRFRGASGVITSRQVSGPRDKKKVKSVLVKWKMHRKGVSCFRVRGQKRAKSDWMTELSKADRSEKLKMWDNTDKDKVLRFEEEAKSIHPLSYCNDCPLRLRRLACPCEMTKEVAIRTDGQGPQFDKRSLWSSNPLVRNRLAGSSSRPFRARPYNPFSPFGF